MVAKTFMDKNLGVVSKFSVEVFLYHSDEKIRRGTLYSFINFAYLKNCASEGYVTIFRRNCFVSQYRIIS